jgi:hypothetical protein
MQMVSKFLHCLGSKKPAECLVVVVCIAISAELLFENWVFQIRKAIPRR